MMKIQHLLKLVLNDTRYKQEGDLSSKPKTGRGRCSTPATDRQIVEMAIESPLRTSTDIHKQIGNFIF